MCFLIQKQADSALFYQQQGMAIALACADTAAQTKLLQNMSVTYREIGDLRQAKQYALRVAKFHETAGEKINTCFNLAYIYYGCAQYDSAAFYLDKVVQIPEKEQNAYTLASVYNLLTKIEKANNNYQKALNYSEKYTKQIFDIYKEKEAQTVAGIQEKYDLERVKNKNRQLLIHRLWITLMALLAVLFLTGGVFFLYHRNSRQKIKLLHLAQAHHKLQSSHTGFYKKAGLLKQSLKTVVGNDELSEKIYQKIIRIFYDAGEIYTWEGLYPALNKQYNGLFDRLRQQLPQLSDTEFKICCLEYAGFRNKEIAEYVQLKVDTVQAKKSAIRKILGIPPKGKIKNFLARWMQTDESG
jgi:tetratricopeptide (TPR) repeat protein